MTARPPSITVAAYSGGPSVPSARLRLHQLSADLHDQGVELHFYDARRSAYPPAGGRTERVRWATGELSRRAMQIVDHHRSDASVAIVQRELLSTLATAERFIPGPFAFDCDDAIWLNRQGRAAHDIARRAALVICGNDFLADHFASFGRTAVLPTAVDLSYYQIRSAERSAADVRTIGWCGQSSGHRYLDLIVPALRRVLESDPLAEFAVMSDRAPTLDLPADRWRFVPWSLTTEPGFLADLAVGVMPLEATDWERGKCSYKMLSYLASAIPVVVSPVGMNATVLAQAAVGSGPVTTDEWVDALRATIGDPAASRRLGANGRLLVEQEYAVPVVAGRLAAILRSLVPGPGR